MRSLDSRPFPLRAVLPVAILAALALAAAPALASETDGEPEAGVTDLSSAPVSAIRAEDILQALAVPRGTQIETTAPPTVRLPIYFETDSAELRSDARRLLDQLGAALADDDLEGFRFAIEGHTDSVGPDPYNDELSERRAAAVRRFLVDRGVEPERLEAVGHGEGAPVASNETPDGRERNRRVEVINRGVAR